jgi:Holliday junction resolvase
MSSYRKGVRLENAVVKFFRSKDGWFANRFTAHGDMDVAVWNKNNAYVIECKNTKMSMLDAERLFLQMQERFKNSLLQPILLYRHGANLRVLPEFMSDVFKDLVV